MNNIEIKTALNKNAPSHQQCERGNVRLGVKRPFTGEMYIQMFIN